MLFQGDAPEGRDTFQWPVIERDRVGRLRLIIWNKVKVPLCHYRVMHRKRVTSELHDSYFRRKESHHPAEWPLDLRLSIKRTKKTQCDGHKSEGQNIAVSDRSPAPSHSKAPHNLFEPLQIKWEVNIVKEVFLRLLFIASVCIQHIYVYFCMNQQMTIQQYMTCIFSFGQPDSSTDVTNMFRL